QSPSVRSDLFAVGLVLWELLCGKRLFSGDNEAMKMMKTYECMIPALAEVGITAPAEVENVMRRLLARDPAARYPSADEALIDLLNAPGGRSATSVDLKAYLASIGITGMPPIAKAPTPPPPKKGSTLTAVGELSGSVRKRRFGTRPVMIALIVLAF